MNMMHDPARYALFAPASCDEQRWSMRDSYVPAAGLLIAVLASGAMWVGLAHAVRWAATSLF